MSLLSEDAQRLWAATGMVLAYAAMCGAIAWGQWRKRRESKRRRMQLQPDQQQASGWIIAFGSQTGTAEELAQQSADTLRLAGISVHVCTLSELGLDALAGATRILFITSTYGEGDAPDNAAVFAGRLMDDQQAGPRSLQHLHYAVLALGDSSYAAYCGFGKALDQCLQQRGAQPMFDRIDVDRCDAQAISTWRQQLSHLAGTSDLPDWNGAPFSDWRLLERRLLNPGSLGEAVFHLELQPVAQQAAQWQSGDLVQIMAPSDPTRPREYSIASIAEEGRVHLLLRLHRHADGRVGHASGWLGTQLEVGGIVPLRLRQHRRFQLGDNAERPLILIGNGTGIAGLRGHLKARMQSGAHANWLIFGERNRLHDFHYHDEIESWQASGALERLDAAFSRDQPQRRYVQDCLLHGGDAVRAWVERGAAIYVCGSLQGMAGGVDDALRQLLGDAVLDNLNVNGRYRRDVY
ncbi:MAG: sulfite reductase subunit alpha [Pseudomonadota bacterium]